MATIKKYQNSGPGIKDSTAIYKRIANKAALEMGNATSSPGMTKASNKIAEADKNAARQKFKGKPGYDKMGFPVKKKMKNGGSLSGLKASNKRVGPIDPKGAWTKVQEKTLAGAKGKASLTRDKELGATKMKSKAKKK